MNERPHNYYEYLLNGYLDGELNQNDKAELEKHLESCTSCRESLESLKGLSKSL